MGCAGNEKKVYGAAKGNEGEIVDACRHRFEKGGASCLSPAFVSVDPAALDVLASPPRWGLDPPNGSQPHRDGLRTLALAAWSARLACSRCSSHGWPLS